ncbi:MAG: ABC transporter ATP-binding protein [Mycoplasma sp.]
MIDKIKAKKNLMLQKTLTSDNYVKEKKLLLKKDKVLDITNLKVSFKNKLGYVQAVRGIDLSLNKGEIVGLVGESGSGKSVSVKTLLGFNDGSITTADNLNLNGIDLNTISKKTWAYIRGTKVGYIPQDPLMSLDPTKKIKTQIIDAIKITQKRKFDHSCYQIKNDSTKSEVEKEKLLKEAKLIHKKNTVRSTMHARMIEVLNFIGIVNPEDAVNSYPHEFSGGMRQRIVIAITLIGEPDIIIADEPTTALDVTIQAKVIDLIKKLRDELGISIIFISHNIALVANLCDYVYIMYAGKIVEKGTTTDIFTNPKHPYTWALISSIPDVNSDEELISIPGTPPNMISPPKGDAYAARNKYARKIDFEKEPPLFKVSNTQYAATWLLHPDAPKLDIPSDIKIKMQIAKKSLSLKEAAKNSKQQSEK